MDALKLLDGGLAHENCIGRVALVADRNLTTMSLASSIMAFVGIVLSQFLQLDGR